MKNAISKTSQLNTYLKELHLPFIRSNYECFIENAIKASSSYESLLFELFEGESELRCCNRISRLLRQSNIPLEKTLDLFDLKRLPDKTMQKVRVLIEGSFLQRKENVLVFGNPGSGKTHLLCAIGHELIKQNKRVLFTTCSILVQELLIAKKDLKLAKKIKQLDKFDALIIDDIGYVQQNREEMEVLFTLLAERYERGSIMISSNLPFSKWENIFKDPMVTVAAIDRLVHHSVIIELNLKSYRMEHATKKTKD